jgi:hypothetical protein
VEFLGFMNYETYSGANVTVLPAQGPHIYAHGYMMLASPERV